jgi:hypothetical protein
MLVWRRVSEPAEQSSAGFCSELHSNSPAARSSVRIAEGGCTTWTLPACNRDELRSSGWVRDPSRTQPLLLRRGISCIDIGEGERQRHVGIFLTRQFHIGIHEIV